MNKKLNTFIRIIGFAAAGAALFFAFSLKGKVSTATTSTAWTTLDAEIKAPADFSARMTYLGEPLKKIVQDQRKKSAELEGNVKDLQADVADKKTKIEGLTANVTTLEGERAELTRKRDEITGQLTEANSKKDSAVAELSAAKEELVKEKEKTAVLFTKEQMEENAAKAVKAEETRDRIGQKYVQLYGWAAGRSETRPPFPRDPLNESAPETVVAGGSATSDEGILTKIIALDPSTGHIVFSVGDINGVKPENRFEVYQDGKRIGAVSVLSVKTGITYAQILPGADQLRGISTGITVKLVSGAGKIASN